MVWGAIAGAVIGGYLSSKGAKSAAKAQADSAEASMALQKQMFDKQVELQEPFRQAGLTAQDRLMMMLGLKGDAADPNYGKYARDFSMADFEADPGYAFRLSEGLKALDRQAAARGGLISGGALKASQRYGQAMASDEYMNAFNRYQTNRANQLNPLQSLMGASQTATNTLTNAAGDYGRSAGDTLLERGNARASGYVGQANAWNQAIGNATNSWLDWQALKKVGG